MNSSINRDSICSLIHKQRHQKSRHSDITYHMTLNIIFSVVSIYDEDSSVDRWMFHNNNNYLEPCFLVSTTYICSSEVHNVHHWPTWMVLQLLGGNQSRCHCYEKLFGSPHIRDVDVFPGRPNNDHNFKQHACEIGASGPYIWDSRLSTQINTTLVWNTCFLPSKLYIWFSAAHSVHHRPT